MVCLGCGNPVDATFCTRCGMRVPPLGRPSARDYASVPRKVHFSGRVQRHLRSLGILWSLFGAYRAVTAAFAVLFLTGVSSRWAFSPWGPVRVIPFLHYNPWLRGAAPFLAAVTILGAAVDFTIAFSLLRARPWGRSLAMVVGILVLIRIPVGTILGAYTLWVLAPSSSAGEYDALTHS